MIKSIKNKVNKNKNNGYLHYLIFKNLLMQNVLSFFIPRKRSMFYFDLACCDKT